MNKLQNNTYVCPRCRTKYLDIDLIRTQCSENYVGSYMLGNCPRCLNNLKLVELVKVGKDDIHIENNS